MSQNQNLFMTMHEIIELIGDKNSITDSIAINEIHRLLWGNHYLNHYLSNRTVNARLRRIWYLIDSKDYEDAIYELRMFQLQYTSMIKTGTNFNQAGRVPPRVTPSAYHSLKDWMYNNGEHFLLEDKEDEQYE